MVEFERRAFTRPPGAVFRVKDVDGLNAASAESDELGADFDKGMLMAFERGTFGLNGLPGVRGSFLGLGNYSSDEKAGDQ